MPELGREVACEDREGPWRSRRASSVARIEENPEPRFLGAYAAIVTTDATPN